MNRVTPKAPSPSGLRVIALALAVGPMVFAIMVAVLLGNGMMQDRDAVSESLGVLLTVVGAISFASSFVVRGRLLKSTADGGKGDAARRYATGTLAFYAMLEAAMLLGILAWLLTRQPLPGVVVSVLAFAVAIASLPSDEAFEELER